jgi:4-amino-4-deoxychorismate mutase
MSGLEPHRARLDEIDEELVRLLAQRFDVCRAVAEHKRLHDIPMMQPDRVSVVRERYLTRGAERGLPAAFTASFFELMLDATCEMEDELIAASPSTQIGEEGK